MNDGKQHCILIVDDEARNLDVLCSILSPMYTIKTAKSGNAAIRMAEKHNPDLILLDIIMPDMSGFEVLSHLKGSDSTRSIPVIFITGLYSSQDEEKGLLLGAVDYIIKPFNHSVVKLRVGTHLRILEQMRTIERLGMIDALTGIPNRRSFDHRLDVEWRRAVREKKPIGILMMDIDKFKSFNDNYGHACGDVVLKNVAGIIADTLKRPADFAARWGGEEFAALLPDTGLDESVEIAEQIRANIERMDVSYIGKTDAGVTISIGVNSETPDENSRIDDFIVKSDKALYLAKESGRNAVKTMREQG